MNFTIFEGKCVAYRTEGKGQALVLLHGLCEDGTIWDEFIKPLSGEFQIIRPDLSGFGESDILAESSIDKMADSVKAVLTDLNVSRCVMVGHSLGGYVTTAFAKRHPSIIAGFGLFHSHPFQDTEEKKTERRRAIEFVKRNGHVLYVKQLIPRLFAELFATSNEFLINSLIFKASQYKPETIVSAQQAMLDRADNGDVLKNATCPVLLIIGKQDTSVPFEVSKLMLSLPSIADIVILPRVAHMGLFTAKDRTAKEVRRFVALCNTMGN